MDDGFAVNKADYARRTGESPNPSRESNALKARRCDMGAKLASATGTASVRVDETLMEAVVEKENMMAALARVVSNKGAAGVAGISAGNGVRQIFWSSPPRIQGCRRVCRK